MTLEIPLFEQIPAGARLYGTGFDITENRRFQSICRNYGTRFTNKVLSQTELSANSGKITVEKLQRHFCAKEAFIKAAGHSVPYRQIALKGNTFVLYAKMASIVQEIGLNAATCRFTVKDKIITCCVILFKKGKRAKRSQTIEPAALQTTD